MTGTLVVVLPLLATACATWRVSNADPATVIPARDPYRVRVLVRDRGALVLRYPEIRNDSLAGMVELENDRRAGLRPDAVALADIVRFQIEEHGEDDAVDWLATIGAGVLGVLGVILALGL